MRALVQRLCPHVLGWSYNAHRRRRWCRLCSLQQRRDPATGGWEDFTYEEEGDEDG